MPYLIAAVVLVGALCLLDLLVTIGLIRRLRAQQAARTPADAFADEGLLAPGAAVGAFETSTVDGSRLRSRDLAAGTVVAFLTPGCPPCHDQLPRLVSALGASPGSGAVAVVAGGRSGEAETEQMLGELGPVAEVVHEPDPGPLTEAFAARAFPALYRVRPAGDELVVEAVGEHVLPAPAPSRR